MFGAIAALGTLLSCASGPAQAPPGVLVISQEQQASWVRNFNPLLVGAARWPSNGGVFEPLAVYNSVTTEWTPWLAESWSWEEPGLQLRFELRDDVLWSDGQPFDQDDVLFTWNLVLSNPALDSAGLRSFVEQVSSPEPGVVLARFKRPFVPGFAKLAHQVIVPEHQWSQVQDLALFTNPDPVGTGPFTQVLRFETQVWELGRNERHWMGVPAVERLRFPALPSNDAANLALVFGEVDWAGNFVPAVQRVFVDRDPAHRGYWFPTVGDTIFLYTNTQLPALSDARVRRALSMAVNRELLVKVALYDYAPPAHTTGMSEAYGDWRRDDLDPTWVRYDPAAAAALLDEAGFEVGPDGMRRGPDGQPITLELTCPTGWSDWVRATQVIARDLRAVGVDVQVRNYDFGAWFDRVTRGEFELTLGWSRAGETPYELYRGLMGSDTVQPMGESAAENWHRFSHPDADAQLAVLERSADPIEQRAASDALQDLFIQHAPSAPLFPSCSWGEYNSARFTGFPSADNPYARLSPNYSPEQLLVLTALRPRDDAMARDTPQ